MTGPKVALVNRTFATRFLKPGNPVGQEFRPGGPFKQEGTYQVIGLVDDAIYRSLRAGMMPVIYIPLTQWERPSPSVTLAVRSAGAPPLTLARSVSAALTAQDSRVAISSHSLSAQVDAALVQERLLATVSVFFGGLALLLAGLGLYGVTSYAVTSRRTEIGIRMALGANPGGVVRLVLRRVVWLVLAGIAVGHGTEPLGDEVRRDAPLRSAAARRVDPAPGRRTPRPDRPRCRLGACAPGRPDRSDDRAARELVPWNRDSWDKSRSAAPGGQGERSEHIGHM